LLEADFPSELTDLKLVLGICVRVYEDDRDGSVSFRE